MVTLKKNKLTKKLYLTIILKEREKCVRNPGGRPVGTSIQDQMRKKETYGLMMNEICEKYHEVRRTGGMKRLGKGVLDRIINEAHKKYDVRNGSTVSQSTIRSRVLRCRLTCKHRGTRTPMEALEPAILEIAIQRGRMNQPLTVTEGLQLANSLIKKGSKTEADVMMYLRKRGQLTTVGSSTKIPSNLLGPGYWTGFRKRHKDKLVSQRGVQFGHNRSEWCSYKNFDTMYNLVYEAMAQAGVAKKLPVKQWQNMRGESVSMKDAVGEKVEYEITHPDHILYVDEVGNNTCQRDDGSKGGQKFLGARGSQARKGCSISDAHWTTLGFTSSDGKPVMCAVIFASQTLTVEERLGIDIFARAPTKAGTALFGNYGEGKYFPGGPTCTFRGCKIPCYVTATPKGSITSEVLRNMLRRIDQTGACPRVPGGSTPFLLLDGHGSRLELPFLSYVNDPMHKWVVCIGVPNGTSLWQVGDSTEQNGCFKMYCSEYKNKLTSKKLELGMFNLNISRTDIIPIVNYAWKRSFARVETNIKARQSRGWGPLNKILLSHPEIISTKPTSEITDIPAPNMISNDSSSASVSSSPSSDNSKKGIDVADMNISEGFAGEVLRTIVRKLQRDKQTLDNLQKSRDTGTDFLQSMKHMKRWTAGVIFENKKCHLDEEVLQIATEHMKKKEQAYWKKVRKYYDEYFKKKRLSSSI